MAISSHNIIPPHLLSTDNVVITNYENVQTVSYLNIIGAGHPTPDKSGLYAARKIIEIAQKAQINELVLVLLSGGGSSLAPCPAFPISFSEKQSINNLLLASGANIQEINTVRKHFSALKGGQLIKHILPADVHTLILSDVIDNDLSTIASGPTVPDATTFLDVIKILKKYSLWKQLPEAIRSFCDQGVANPSYETLKPPLYPDYKHHLSIIGSNTMSINSIITRAKKYYYETHLYSSKLCGEAKEEAKKILFFAQKIISQGLTKPTAIIAGGETTVTLNGQGIGGRNQEMALAFSIAAENYGLAVSDWVFLSAGTDGRDGPTAAAGAIVDPFSFNRMVQSSIDPTTFLTNNDSNTALAHSNDLFITGATGTNVADLQILILQPF
jgi:hydroxypyruvate reductase